MKLKLLIVILLLFNSFTLSINSDLSDKEMMSDSIDSTIELKVAPNPPTNRTPENGSFGHYPNAELEVKITHPEGNTSDVYFVDAGTNISNSSDDVILGHQTGVNDGSFVSYNWTGLETNKIYNWFVRAESGEDNVTTDIWSFSTSTVDNINITTSPGGEEIKNKSVPVEKEIWANCSAYNSTNGYLGTVSSNWSAGGGNASLLKHNPTYYNGIDVGEEFGKIWFNASYENHNDIVELTVLEPTIDYIKIVESNNTGFPEIDDKSVNIQYTQTGYAAGYNNTVGFYKDVIANWDVEKNGTEAFSIPEQGTNSTFDAGSESGDVVWKATYNSLMNDTVNITIEPPKIDYIQIRNEQNNKGHIFSNLTLQKNETFQLFASGYNHTYGYQKDLEVSWASDNNDAISISDSYGNSTNITAVEEGNGNIYSIYQELQNHTSFDVVERQEPKISGDIDDIRLNEDFGVEQVNLSDHANDLQDDLGDLKWYITGINESIFVSAGENLTGNHIISFISQKNKFGNTKVKYWLKDSDGNVDSQTAWINVTEVNDGPLFKNTPDLYIRYDEPYVFDYSPYIIDVDNKLSDLTLSCDDTDHTSIEGLKITYEYPESMKNTTFYVEITVSDGDINTDRLIKITITSDYPPENVKELPDVYMQENQTKINLFDLDEYIMDPDGDSLYMSYGYTHLDITIHDNHSVDISSTGEWSGFEKVTFRATDPTGAIIEQTINVTVVPVNDPPQLKKLPPFVVHYDYPYTFDLSWYISDKDNNLNDLNISTSDPEHVDIKGNKIKMLYPKQYQTMTYPYTIPLTITVSDGVDSVFQVTSVSVTDDYPPSVYIPLDDVVFNEDQSIENVYDLDDHFIDKDSETIYYTSGNENITVEINKNNTVDFSAPTNWFGSEMITIRATDLEGALIEDTIKVSVLPVNDPPKISNIPLQEAKEGEDWILDLDRYIDDVDDNIEDLSISVNSTNVKIVGHKLIFDYPSGIYNDSILLNVTDGELNSSTTIRVSIIKPEESNKDGGTSFYWYLLPILPIGIAGIFLMNRNKYTIDDIFLIHNSGMLIKHTTREMKAQRDEDILAGMFTAVQNFVDDAFAENESESLKRMDYGDKKVLIQRGKNVTLAVFFTGNEPRWALDSMKELVKDVEKRYSNQLEEWDGDIENKSEIINLLKKFLKGRYKTNE